MGKNLEKRKLAQEAKADLKDKAILIVGNRFYSEYYKMALEEAGATVSFSDEYVTDFLMPAVADKICLEIAALDPKPDMIMVFQPGMRCTDALSFNDEPAIRVASEAKKHNVPTLILDTPSEQTIGAVETEVMRRAGASYFSSLKHPPYEALALASQVIKNKEKNISTPAL